MSAFDKIIGYDSIKNELFQICDMIQNKEKYTKIGASLPKGVILSGYPGLGKTMLSKAFIEQSGISSYTLRRNKGNGDFIEEITDVFEKAKENAPCIVFLDDMDKFANEDRHHCDAEEYVAVQAGIDYVADKEVFVIATVNDMEKLPKSLIRSGRFDRIIEIESPDEEDAAKIIEYYLSNKKVSTSINFEDLAKMISYSSCAELETILNEAAISAAYKGKECVEMSDLVSAVLREQYSSPDETYITSDDDETRSIAIHEAGHLVCSEVLCPGSVGLATIRPSMRGGKGGFIHRCKDLKRRPYYILVSLASKAAVELYYADHVASGCYRDLNNAVIGIREGLGESGTAGFETLDLVAGDFRHHSESFLSRHEAVTQALLEQYFMKARDIIIKNRDFLELVADELVKKGTLLYSDIKRIKETVTVTTFTV